MPIKYKNLQFGEEAYASAYRSGRKDLQRETE